MKDKPTIKPCPFCGGYAKIHGLYLFTVTCTECGAQTAPSSSDSEVIKAWNSRVKDE